LFPLLFPLEEEVLEVLLWVEVDFLLGAEDFTSGLLDWVRLGWETLASDDLDGEDLT